MPNGTTFIHIIKYLNEKKLSSRFSVACADFGYTQDEIKNLYDNTYCEPHNREPYNREPHNHRLCNHGIITAKKIAREILNCRSIS